MVLQSASVTQKIKASSLPSSSSRCSPRAPAARLVSPGRLRAVRGPKGGGGRNVRRRVRLPRLRSRAYDLPLLRATFNRGEIQAPSFLPKFFAPLTPRSLQFSSTHFSFVLFREGGVTCFSTFRDLALSFPRGRIPFSSRPFRPSRITRKTRSCEQFFFSSPILQILHACKYLPPTVTRSFSGESRENDGEKGRQDFEWQQSQ